MAGNGITPVQPGGVYGKTLVNPDLNDFSPRIGFAYAPYAEDGDPRRLRHGLRALHARRFGRHSGHQRAAGAVRRGDAAHADHDKPLRNPLPAQIIPVGSTTPSCYATSDQGFPPAW